TPDEADLVYVERRNGKTELRPLGEAGIHALDGVAEEMGLRRADLLQLQRMVLFVEGVHDQAVLEAYVGDVLRRERVLVLPMHGTHNAMALADSEILWELGIPVGVFTDNKLSWKSTDETSR